MTGPTTFDGEAIDGQGVLGRCRNNCEILAKANHERCPGGHHTPGVLGGWHCPCPCHRAAPDTSQETT